MYTDVSGSPLVGYGIISNSLASCISHYSSTFIFAIPHEWLGGDRTEVYNTYLSYNLMKYSNPMLASITLINQYINKKALLHLHTFSLKPSSSTHTACVWITHPPSSSLSYTYKLSCLKKIYPVKLSNLK